MTTTQLNVQARLLRQRGAIIMRPRLFALLAERRPVTLISAPAGYGKTVLVESWLDTRTESLVWLTLDERHRELARFTSDLTAAARPLLPPGIETASPDSGAPTPADRLSAMLSMLPAQTIIVLDGYHVLERSETQTLIGRIVQRLPRTLRLVLLTRHDSPLAFTSLRTHGLLTEVQMNALRFTAAETAALLAQMPDAPADDATVARLLEATEGWITGMLLAIPYLRDQAEISAALASLQKGNPHILEYLTVEVLDQEPVDVQEFLIKTSILDRMHPALCASLLNTADKSQDFLRIMRDNNLFVHEVEGSEGWVRYARLFQYGLRIHLHHRCRPDEIARLHQRASAWFAAAGMIDEALRHAVAAGDMPHAIQLVAQRRHDLMNSEEWATLQRWLDYFDRTTVINSPDLSLAEAWLLLNQSRIQELAPLLEHVEQLLADAATASTATATIASWRAEVEALRCQHLLVTGQPRTVISLAGKAVTALPVTWQLARSFVIFSQSAALQMVGDLAQANALLDDALIWPQSYPSVFHVRVLAAQCQVQWLAADLPAALRAARQVFHFSERLHLAQMYKWGAYSLGSIYYLWNELEQAAEVLEPVVHHPEAGHSIAFANASCTLAATYQAQGRVAEANAILSAATEFMRTTNRLHLPMLQAFTAELALRQHDIGRAAQLVVQQPLVRPDAPAFHFLAPQLVRPKVLLALNQPAARQEAATLLAAAQTFFTETHNTRFLVETLVLLAILHATDNRRADALATLRVALRLAQPGGLVRVFADVGPCLTPLLDALMTRYDTPALVNQIRSAMRAETHHSTPPAAPNPALAERAASPLVVALDEPNVAALAEALTARELDVLAAMAQHLTSREIAERLGISAHTIKHHIGNILGKLEVTDRRQAVVRARNLGLLHPSQHA